MRLLVLPCVLALAACDPAVSRRALVASGGDQPLPGLWALMEPDCAQPRDGAVQTWPACATPVWVQPGEATVLPPATVPGEAAPAPIRTAFVLAAGEPRILQFEAEADGSQPRFGYYALRTSGPAPYRSALMWIVTCEGGRGEASTGEGDLECLVEDEAELRRLARNVVREPSHGRAAYIGPG